MARSPEYPDLPWVEPRSWSRGRGSGQPTVIVIHTTEGHEKATSAEDGAAYDARRTDGTSTHYFHDQNSTVQCVRTTDRAHTARSNGNRIGIQHELCGRAGQTPDQWADPASEGTLRRAAKQCARDARKYAIPVRKLTVSQVRSGMRGFCGHVDITYAFPQDNGSHTDPGVNFPWGKFLAMVEAELHPKTAATAAETEDDDMTAGQLKAGEKRGEVVIKKGDKPSALHLLVTGGDLRVVIGARKAGADEQWRGIKDITLRDGDDRVDIELDSRCNGVYIEAFAPDGTEQGEAGTLAYIVDCNR